MKIKGSKPLHRPVLLIVSRTSSAVKRGIKQWSTKEHYSSRLKKVGSNKEGEELLLTCMIEINVTQQG
jgi:hypothetical protein